MGEGKSGLVATALYLIFKQYLPKKPNKWGVKVWVLVESSNGYVPAFEIYTGATDNAELGVVMRLMEARPFMLTTFIRHHSCSKTSPEKH